MIAQASLEGTRFEGAFQWADQTNVHPLALLALLIMAAATLAVPRRFSVIPLIALSCIVTTGQCVYFIGLNFHFDRLGVLAVLLRIIINDEARGLFWTKVDKLICAWAACGTLAYTALYSSSSALVFMLGQSFDAIGMYFVFRVLARDWRDLRAIAVAFAVLSLFVFVAFLYENSTGRNPFSIFGYVSELTPIREGKLRCQGAFAHPILAGCYWASVIPLLAAFWWSGTASRWMAPLGVGACVMIVLFSNSSTPAAAIVFALVGGAMFGIRTRMRHLRWMILVTLVGLHLVMKGPVWHLISRIDVVGGSTGWHRYALIDAAIRRFPEWALVGTPGTAHWGWGLEDVTNQYILEGVRGGAVTLALFFAIIACSFGSVGRLWRAVQHDRRLVAIAWGLGVMLFVHCMNFIAVSYFGQIKLTWFMTIALIQSMAVATSVSVRAAVRRGDVQEHGRDGVRLSAKPILR